MTTALAPGRLAMARLIAGVVVHLPPASRASDQTRASSLRGA